MEIILGCTSYICLCLNNINNSKVVIIIIIMIIIIIIVKAYAENRIESWQKELSWLGLIVERYEKPGG